MPSIEDIGEAIAVREMEFVYDTGLRENVVLRVGMPRECEDPEAWVCPYEIRSESHQKIFGMVGIDSLQALELTMKTLKVEIEYWERSRKGKFFFLDEEGAAI